MVKIPQFILLIASLFICGPSARASDSEHLTPSYASVEGECDLPAPQNLVVTNVGPTFITINWSPGHTAAVSYNVRVKVRDQYGQWQLVIDSMYVYGTTFTALNLQPGRYYRLEVAGICEREKGVSPYFSSVERLTLIIDLVPAFHYELPQKAPVDCRMNCLELGDIGVKQWFDVTRINSIGQVLFSRYQVWVDYDGRWKMLKVPDSNYPGQTWPGSPVDDEELPPPQTNIQHAYILNESGEKVCKVTFEIVSGERRVCIASYLRGYSVRCIQPNDGDADNQAAQRSGSVAFSSTPVVVNPFSDQLTIRIPELQPENPVVIHLFDSNGRIVSEQKIFTVQEFNLPTTHLPPGLYVLRIRSNQNTHTLKVIKSH